jgi:transposase
MRVELTRSRGHFTLRGRRCSNVKSNARKKHRTYPAVYREQLIELIRAGRTPESLAREFEPSAQTIRNWVTQADRDAGRTGGMTTAEQEELRRLRRENRQLKVERDILSKATAWFARETGTIPTARNGRSDS